MPELPEVETVVRELRKEVRNRTFLDTWTDSKKLIKKPIDFNLFKKQLKGKKIERLERRAKNILFRISGGKTLLVHLKMTGHLLSGKWKMERGKWKVLGKNHFLEDPMNRFIHLIFWLDNGEMLALSDLRKFAKVELWTTSDLENSEGFRSIGPEPLQKSFTFQKFKEATRGKKGKIKKVLLDQKTIAGIGNIYSDEMLFKSKIHPLKEVSRLSGKELKRLYFSMKEVLKLGIKLGGESFSDFRRLSGKKGNYDSKRLVYRRTGEKCSVCQSKIQKVKVGGRSAHFCPKCQRLNEDKSSS
ncbi:MAG: DNA-formamidopyrimidine glycosylase [Candidatus Nealsonbacteria bacterium]